MRRAIQASDEKNVDLAKRLGFNRKTIAKWRWRESTSDEPMGPKNPPPRLLTTKDEVVILTYRWRTGLALNACHERLRRLMPKLSRSALHRCLERYGLSKISKTATASPLTCETLMGAPYCFEITANKVVFPYEAIGASYGLFMAVEEVTKQVYAEVVMPTPENAAAFLVRLAAEFPQKIIAVTTVGPPTFADWRAGFDEDMAIGPHPFAVACRAHKITHSRTIPPRARPAIMRARGVEIG